MAGLPKLMLKPYRDGYNFGLANPTVITPTAAGLSRGRVDSVGGVHVLSPTYKCTRPMQQYLFSFLRAYRGQRFLAYLILDDIDHRWYECMITTQGPIPMQSIGDQIFVTQLEMQAEPIDYDVETDMTITAIYELTDGQSHKYFAQLSKLDNEILPDALGGLT